MKEVLKQHLLRIEELADECQDTIDALQHVLIQARKSSDALRGACEYIEEFHELRAIEARDRHPVDGDSLFSSPIGGANTGD